MSVECLMGPVARCEVMPSGGTFSLFVYISRGILSCLTRACCPATLSSQNSLSSSKVLPCVPFFPPSSRGAVFPSNLHSFRDPYWQSAYIYSPATRTSPPSEPSRPALKPTMKFSTALIALALAFAGAEARMEHRRGGPSAVHTSSTTP